MGPMLLGYMIVGMLMFRNGYLLARWRVPGYLALALPCLAAAWAIDAMRVEAMGVWVPGNDVPYLPAFFAWMWVGGIEGLLGAIGYAGLVNAGVRLGFKAQAFAAAGRMAFTNYIACSLIGTTLAYGHAGGLLGRVTLLDAMVLVGIVWVGVLLWSPLWLAVFRFGPLEWLWRSLTYGRPQPFLRAREA